MYSVTVLTCVNIKLIKYVANNYCDSRVDGRVVVAQVVTVTVCQCFKN